MQPDSGEEGPRIVGLLEYGQARSMVESMARSMVRSMARSMAKTMGARARAKAWDLRA